MKNASHLPCVPQSFPLLERAMRISLAVGLFIVAAKVSAYVYSGSIAVMSDMLESLVHNLAVLFAVYCLWISKRPADENHLYGHGKIQFVSAAAEGGLVFAAGLAILYQSAIGFWYGYELREVSTGLVLMVGAGVVNGVLGWYLMHVGSQEKSLIVRANGVHVLSDTYTTIFAIVGAAGAWLTGMIYIDLIVAVLGGFYIISEALKLLREAIGGLLDEADLTVDETVRDVLKRESDRQGWRYHELRHRTEGNRNWIEVHLIFNDQTSLKSAHQQASNLEATIADSLDDPVIITTHLEPESHKHEAV